jgi:hypothetical protein
MNQAHDLSHGLDSWTLFMGLIHGLYSWTLFLYFLIYPVEKILSSTNP